MNKYYVIDYTKLDFKKIGHELQERKKCEICKSKKVSNYNIIECCRLIPKEEK